MTEFDIDESYINEKFEQAIKYVPTIVSTLSAEQKLALYGFYKQATEGSCNIPRPGFFNFEAKSKWDAWNKNKDMDKLEAKQKYIDELDDIDSAWFKKKVKGNVYVSRPKFQEGDNIEINGCLSDKSVFDYANEGNLDELKKIIENNTSLLNNFNENGLHLIHCACDRGNSDIVQYLLEKGISINLKDEDGQTPIIYACAGDYLKVVQVLLNFKSSEQLDLSVVDEDGLNAIELTTDLTIKQMLQNHLANI